MIKIQTDIEDFEIKEKFNFNSFKRKFKLSSNDKKSSPAKVSAKKLSFKNLFRSEKKEQEPEIKFKSGYGEFKLDILCSKLSQFKFS